MSKIVAIINATPDSFSGDGVHQHEYWQDMIQQQCNDFYDAGGRDVDIGAESTRPGAAPIDSDEEIKRIAPVLEFIRKNYPEMSIGIDTMKSSVAEFSLDHGADMINDVSGLQYDQNMAHIVKKYQCPVVLMHNRAKWQEINHHHSNADSYNAPDYQDFKSEYLQEIKQMIDHALESGIDNDKLILDPGIGFGKDVAQNIALFTMVADLRQFGVPLYYGPSRKSFIGRILNRDADQRLAGTASCVAYCLQHHIDYIRVHDALFFQEMKILYHKL